MSSPEIPGRWSAWLRERVHALTDYDELERKTLSSAFVTTQSQLGPGCSFAFLLTYPDPSSAPSWCIERMEHLVRECRSTEWWRMWFSRACAYGRRHAMPRHDVAGIAVMACGKFLMQQAYPRKSERETKRLLSAMVRHLVFDDRAGFEGHSKLEDLPNGVGGVDEQLGDEEEERAHLADLRRFFAELWCQLRSLKDAIRRAVLLRYLERDRTYADVGLVFDLREEVVGRHVRLGVQAIWNLQTPEGKRRILRLDKIALRASAVPGSHKAIVLKLLSRLARKGLQQTREEVAIDVERRIGRLPAGQRRAVESWIEMGELRAVDEGDAALALEGREQVAGGLSRERPDLALLVRYAFKNPCANSVLRTSLRTPLATWIARHLLPRIRDHR
ncbi:MAG: hypothetical protein GY711_20940 [bacterium]|nr:hypothetical protein [bacterium]